MSAGRSSQESRLLLGRTDVVVDVLEVDLRRGSRPTAGSGRARGSNRAPCWRNFAHPLRLVLVLRDRLHDLVRVQPAAGLEEVLLGIVEAVERHSLPSSSDATWVLSGRRHYSAPPAAAGVKAAVALGLELLRESRSAFLHDTPVDEDVHEVRRDVFEDALIVRDHRRRSHVGADELLDAARMTMRSASMSQASEVGSPSEGLRDPRLSIAICGRPRRRFFFRPREAKSFG